MLLRRLQDKPHFESCLIDEGLRTVMVPFNERSASASAVSLPRGSSIPVPSGKLVRMFLHWCQPRGSGHTTDLDLSVGFYDRSWQQVGVCSYYELECRGRDGSLIARSAGDLQDAPWPDGATELVDVHREPALATGVRYAVMVLTNYAGLPFSLLERGFAGLMLRDDPEGSHFDPRTVELKLALGGENGVFLPLVLDLRENTLHWLDVNSKGSFEMNNVANSNEAITKICPEYIANFRSGARPSMFELGLLHAAARCRRVYVRGATLRGFTRHPDEAADAFLGRLLADAADEPDARPPVADGDPLLALLRDGDIALPEGSPVYVLFRKRLIPTLAASDLLS